MERLIQLIQELHGVSRREASAVVARLEAGGTDLESLTALYEQAAAAIAANEFPSIPSLAFVDDPELETTFNAVKSFLEPVVTEVEALPSKVLDREAFDRSVRQMFPTEDGYTNEEQAVLDEAFALLQSRASRAGREFDDSFITTNFDAILPEASAATPQGKVDAETREREMEAARVRAEEQAIADQQAVEQTALEQQVAFEKGRVSGPGFGDGVAVQEDQSGVFASFLERVLSEQGSEAAAFAQAEEGALLDEFNASQRARETANRRRIDALKAEARTPGGTERQQAVSAANTLPGGVVDLSAFGLQKPRTFADFLEERMGTLGARRQARQPRPTVRFT